MTQMSFQSLVPSLCSPPPHPPESDDNLEISRQPPSTRLPSHPHVSDNRPKPDIPGSSDGPLMSPSQLISIGSQTHNNQQMLNNSPILGFQQVHGYLPTHSYPPTYSYSMNSNSPSEANYSIHSYPYSHYLPPTPGYPPINYHLQRSPHHYPSTPSQGYRSASPYPGPSAAMPNNYSRQPNTEPSNTPIPQSPPPNYRSIDTRHSTPPQTQAYIPAPPGIPLADNTNIQSPNKGMLVEPPMSHTTPAVAPPTGDSGKEVVIAVMGVTGTGKSYFIKEVFGISDVEVSSSLHSCTTKVQPYSFHYERVKITLVDTPGFNDTTKSDIEILTDICAWMSSNYRKGNLLSGIIYLHRITDVRMDGSSLKNLKMFQKLCGPDAMQNVLLTTTHWSNVNPALGAEREGNLRHEDFWAGLISQGASLERFMGTRESGLELITKLIEKEPKPLHIQDQMVEDGIALVDSDVGKFMNEELISLQKKYEKDLEDLERERQSALKENDDEMEMILAEEQAKARERLEEAAAERKLLLDLREAEMRQREDAERQREEDRQKSDKAVIAVASKDISSGAHIAALFKPYNTNGRLIYDTSDMEEFQKDPFPIMIQYQINIAFIPDVIVKTVSGLIYHGVNRNNYIIYNDACYWAKPGGRIKIGPQKFHIFIKI